MHKRSPQMHILIRLMVISSFPLSRKSNHMAHYQVCQMIKQGEGLTLELARGMLYDGLLFTLELIKVKEMKMIG